MPSHDPLKSELTRLVEQCRTDYQRLKAADKEVTCAELSAGRTAYLHALSRLSRFLEQPRDHPQERANGLEQEAET
jgi:hypothetical protein